MEARLVRTADGQCYPFDYLGIATGATHSYFGHDELAPLAPGLKRIEDAVEIRRRILLAFERAEVESSQAERARLLTFAIVAGGPTGSSWPVQLRIHHVVHCRETSEASIQTQHESFCWRRGRDY